ncbi:DNA-binding protein [Pseudomonas sp. FSL R10-0056]|uniref:SdiA-regulated domain-containing protein n=2 Tax=Pseudomonas TaxID=286 RepID=A0ABT4WSC7_PSEFR|nr:MULTISPECIES: SdiA-regulated domain-containing protein [Pseudomonas]MBO6279382.1 SdiA-regulated domain-containing protein [Pseudomonas sp.]MCH4884532.1 DNA-binding protein [Pseudomonas sp. TMW22080]MDA7022939.1 SdiA-regulated domain-containing protein [Pseudomonas fragi]MDN5406942.1 SdiA-regulated domain-containing protein [Pseudomonas sp.]MDN5449215.1 SdiA-regulated domain-containing protein [Pseudomonas sp.]
MRRVNRTTVFTLCITLVALLAAGFAAQHFRLFERTWFQISQMWHPANPDAINLGDYRAVMQGKVIEGLEDDVSALTFDPLRKSLFTVTNKKAELIELSLDGRVLRRIALVGFGDAEAVEFIGENTYVITDERQQRLIKVKVDDNTRVLDARDAEQLTLGINQSGNKGFEGLAYDSVGKRLFVAKERDPMLIYEVRGFPQANPQQPYATHVVSNPRRDARLFVRDLSSLQFDERTGHLLALSDESKLLLELGLDGQPISTLSLKKGKHGLTRSVPQAEGVAMDDEGTIYVVSEPNLFYVFKKPAL